MDGGFEDAGILVNPASGDRYSLVRYSTSIGREFGNDIVLSCDRTISRQHAVVQYINGTFHIEDLGSKNGTRLNGTAVTERMPIGPGDEIVLGITRLIFLLVPREPRRRAERASVPTTENLVHDPVVPVRSVQ